MEDKSMAFVNKTLVYANQNPNVVPEFAKLTRYENGV